MFGLILAVAVYCIAPDRHGLLVVELRELTVTMTVSPPEPTSGGGSRTPRSGCWWGVSPRWPCTRCGSSGPKVVPAGQPVVTRAAGRLVRARAGPAVAGVRLADARRRRGVPLLGPHDPAHAAHLRGAAGDAAGHPRVAGAARARARAGQAGVLLPRPPGAGGAAVQRVPAVHPRPVRGERVGRERRRPLPGPHRAGGHRVPAVDPGGRPAARAAPVVPRADAVPVRHVDRADGAGGVADVRRAAPSTRRTTCPTACSASRSPTTSRWRA